MYLSTIKAVHPECIKRAARKLIESMYIYNFENDKLHGEFCLQVRKSMDFESPRYGTYVAEIFWGEPKESPHAMRSLTYIDEQISYSDEYSNDDGEKENERA